MHLAKLKLKNFRKNEIQKSEILGKSMRKNFLGTKSVS